MDRSARVWLSFCVSLPLCVLLVRLLPLPVEQPAAGIVSFATVYGHGLAGNALLFALCVAVCVAAAAASLRLPALRLRVPWRAVWVCLGAVLFLAFLVNASWSDPGRPLLDTFHEGEYLGYAPAFRKLARPFAQALVIHGFAIDVLPSLLAARFFPASGIAAARVFRMLEIAASWAALSWLAQEVCASVLTRKRDAWTVRAAVAMGLCLLYAPGFAIWAQPRCAASYAQAALALCILRRLRERRGARALTFALCATLPCSILYNYAEAACAGFVVLCAGVLALALDAPRARAAWASGLAGAGCGALFLLAFPGPDALSAIAAQVRFWVQNGGPIWSLPLSLNDLRGLRYFLVIVAAHALALLHLGAALRGQRSLRALVRGNFDVLLLLALSLGGSKTWLDRADWPLLDLGTVPSALLFLALGLRLLRAHATEQSSWPALGAGRFAVLSAACALLLGTRVPVLDPGWAVHRLALTASALHTPDRALLPPAQRAALDALRPQLTAADCFFTLTSEATFYWLLDLPSCSRFHEAVFARTPAAQREVVEALRDRKPPAVLVSSPSYSTCFDGLCPSTTLPVIYQELLETYRPEPRVAEHWIWRRAPSRMGRSSGPPVRGEVTRATQLAATVVLSGSLELARAEGPLLYASDAETGALLEVTELAFAPRRTPFSIEVPSPARARHPVRLWIYDPAADSLVPVARRDGEPAAGIE